MSPDQGGYLPIAEQGIIGDLRTAALVGTDGTVDWFCPGRFDAPSVFASLLDPDRGGHWSPAPRTDRSGSTEPVAQQQFHHPDSTVLITRFLTSDGIVEVQDFLALLRPHDPQHRQRLVRRVTGGPRCSGRSGAGCCRSRRPAASSGWRRSASSCAPRPAPCT